MSGLSPASVLYSSDGYEVAVVQNTTIPTGTRALLISGSDGTNARPILVDSSGREVIVGAGTAGTPVGGIVSIQGVASGTVVPVSGTITANIGTSGSLALDATLAKLTITQSTALGSNTLAMVGGSVTTAAPTYTTGNINPLSLTTAGAVRIDGSGTTQPVSGTITANAGTGNFTVAQATASNLNATIVGTTAAGSGASSGLVTVQGNASGTPIPVSGTVTATNASVSTTGSAPPASATYMGGSVTTAAPTYTTGQMSALSLTTGGLLRIDGSGVTQPVSGTVTANAGTGNFTVVQATASNLNATVVGTTAAGSGASANLVTVQGNASGTPIPVSGTVTATNASVSATGSAPPASATLSGGSVTTSAPSYTTGQMSALSLTTTGLLRVDGSGTTQPVSGTVTANAGTGNFTVVQATASSLNATIIGTTAAGSGASANLVTVQGNASGTPIPVSGTVTATNASVSTTGSAPPASATYMGGSVTTTAPTYTTGQMSALSLTTAGALRIDGSGSTQPVSGTVTANIGTSGSLALDATLTAMSLVDNAAFTDGTTRIQPVAYIFDEVAGTALTENDAAAARIDSKRAQIGVIEDGTTRGTRATVKAASTAAVAGDTALVVAISPNNVLSVTTDKSATSAVTSVGASVTNVNILASNAARVLATMYNDSTSKVWVKLGTTASATSYTILILPGSYWELPLSYTGNIDAIWAAANGSMRVTELS